MPILVNALSQFIPDVDRTVIDRTGLTGTFDVDLRWTPDAAAGGRETTTPAHVLESPSFFAALQEQLGLKLERATGPVEVLVIDSVQRPTPN